MFVTVKIHVITYNCQADVSECDSIRWEVYTRIYL